MEQGCTRYVLSAEADQDIGDLFDFSVQTFGSAQAAEYLLSLEDCLLRLIDNPALGRERPEIRAGLRSVALASHVIFYRIDAPSVRVVGVLHGSRDLPRQFPGDPETIP
ncbi:MAG: type II toxin-antitoxin system RelE/ParE family toxin [Gammaproteobacteria bacterium]|nr:type II toxin-antitoxin system RelE/ParE family toxin [Gammaproteobacteria bacterium]